MTQLTLRASKHACHPPSLKPVFIDGRSGKELFITLATRNCHWKEETGGCRFCGLGGIERRREPLQEPEAAVQLGNFFMQVTDILRGDPHGISSILRASVISMSDGLLNPDTIASSAMARVILAIKNALPDIAAISIESRADDVASRVIDELGRTINRIFGHGISKEIAIGIETPYQSVRNQIARKGMSDRTIEFCAQTLAGNGWGLRGYFIYALFETDAEARVNALKDAVDFMTRLRRETSVELSMLVLKAYVPLVRETEPLFRNFVAVPDATALAELKQAAEYARNNAVVFDIDPTLEDQAAAKASIRHSPEYLMAVRRYCATLDPRCLAYALDG